MLRSILKKLNDELYWYLGDNDIKRIFLGVQRYLNGHSIDAKSLLDIITKKYESLKRGYLKGILYAMLLILNADIQ